MNTPCYLIIGNGRMARHMACYLEYLGIPYHTFARKTQKFSELPALLAKTTHVLILIRDDAIEDFIREHLQDCPHILVHFSGCLSTTLAYGAHPLMSFGHTLHSEDIYRQMWFIVEDNNKTFAELLPNLPNSSKTIPSDAKGLYHSLCVLSSNFTCLLWQKMLNTLQNEWQIPSEAVYPILQQVMNNITHDHNTALTGPLLRNDEKTIHNNLQALADDPYQAVYQAFVLAYQQEKK
jgi:predicted short-subunit dehydrogenase-like oxidoreductase (DUF2520 family)